VNGHPGRDRQRVHDVFLVIMLLVIAWSVYRPDTARPFDYVDFPEDLLVLKAHAEFAEQFQAISQVYADHGRWKPVMHFLLVCQWSWFESWTPGWQWLRFGIMGAVILLAYSLFRRLRLDPLGSLGAAAFLVVSPAAVMGGMRLSTPEPVGLLFLVVACHIAIRSVRPVKAWLMAAMLLGLMWTKEIMTVAFVFPVLLAISVSETGSLERPRLGLNERSVLRPLAVAFMIGSTPILWTWLSAPSGSFASRYGTNAVSLGDVAGASIAAWLPFAPVSANTSTTLIALAAFLALTVAGWAQALQPGTSRQHQRWLLVLSVTVPVLGAVAFAPWPYYLLVYALPFALPGAILLGQAATSLGGVSAISRILAAASLTIVLTFAWGQAANEASRLRALHEVFAQSVTRVAEMPDVDTVLVAVAPEQYDSQGNFGPRFKRYAALLGLRWPDIRDVRCSDPQVPGNRVIGLRLNLMCPTSTSTPTIVVYHYRFEWPSPWPRRDSVTVTFPGSAP